MLMPTISVRGLTAARTLLWLTVGVGVGAARLLLGVTSPSVFETFPRRALAIAQILRIPLTTAGRLSEFRNAV